ncbi:hypothetical protein SO802_028549 [Lithocarpus litseifolius]|uniref:Uncharacterized protein n=1 Tax=Lithocarpus litseifolius TaxID=425828 RepID=A0AAW2BQL2_9ROSI
MHTKGSSHRAAESKLKETELLRRDEINKRVALSDSSAGTANCNTYHQKFRLSLTLMKMIQMYALDEKMWKNLADGHSI